MKRIIDYLAEEEKQQAKREAKRERMAKLVKKLANTKPVPSPYQTSIS